MDRQEYLNQISAEVSPSRKARIPSSFGSKSLWITITCVLAIALILFVCTAAAPQPVTVSDRVGSLLLHIENTSSIIDEYQTTLKSSTLRGYSASLNGVLSDTRGKLETAGYSSKKATADARKSADASRQELADSLFVAKINGDLDNIYDLKMIYEISTLMTQEQSILKNTSSEDLKNIIDPSLKSLSNLYTNFDGFEVGM